jgi:hypothetical protein
LESTSSPTPLPSAQLCSAWAFVHVREYIRTICELAISTLATPFDETMGIFRFFHPFEKVDLPPFVDDFHLKMKVTLNQEAFVFALARSSHFSFDGPLDMVYDFL